MSKQKYLIATLVSFLVVMINLTIVPEYPKKPLVCIFLGFITGNFLGNYMFYGFRNPEEDE